MAGHSIITTTDSYEKDVTDAAMPVILHFGAPWCGPCKLVTPLLLEVLQARPDRLTLAQIDVVEDPAFKTQFQIHAIPCLVLMVRGEEVSRLDGTLSLQAIIGWLDQALPA